MEDQKTAELEAENQAGTETQQSSDVSGTKQPETANTEESPYAAQLRELQKRAEEAEAKLKEKDEILQNKNRAIEKQKEKLKDSSLSEDDLLDRLSKRLEEKLTTKDLSAKVASLTNDEAEREVIIRHYQSSIVKTGNIEEDLKSAVALADRDRVWEQRRNRAMEERREDFITSFSGTSLRGDVKSSRPSNPIQAAAEELVRSINPKAVEFLEKQFKQ